MRLRLLFLCALAAGCTCNKSSALTEKPPDDLPTQGLVIDQPAEGATLSGAWTTVSGWASPAAIQAIFIVGAPVDGFYEPTGHVGAPTVAVTLRPDGRFFAPRVPLQDGEVKLQLIPLAKGGNALATVTRTVTASNTSVVPATLVVDPPQPEPGQQATLRATTGADTSTSFQWDFDGDGTFDAEGASVTHTWATQGRYHVVARTKVQDAWVSAVSKVVVDGAPKVLASAPVQNPSKIRFLRATSFEKTDVVTLPDGGTFERDVVAVIDGDQIRIFSPALEPRFTLTGLSGPRGVARDREGGFLVADTGNARLVRFTGTGALDDAFADHGAYTALPSKPIALTFGATDVLLEDGRGLACVSSPAFNCLASSELGDEEMTARLAKLGATRLDDIVVSARADLQSGVDQSLFLSGGRLLQFSVVRPERDMPVKGKVVDAVLGPNDIYVDYAIVDDAGRVSVYRTASHDGTWTLPYHATAIATDSGGRIYVAGPGVIELRDFEPLR